MRRVILAGLVLSYGCNADKPYNEYMKRAKQAEVMINLDKIGKRAKLEYAETGAFPKLAAGTTPAVSCCIQNAGNKRKCAPTATDWSTPGWAALDFSVETEHYFQYTYTPAADGSAFTATAIGDMDCDNTMVTFTLRGTVVNGGPSVELLEPPPDAD